MSFIWIWICLSHLALILLNAGYFDPTHRTIGQCLPYLEDLAVVRSDDADIVGDYRVVEMGDGRLGNTILTRTAPMEFFNISLNL